MTALQKPSGGAKGIVAGDIVRRLVARTMAQQLRPAVEYAMSTRAGTECVAHALQELTELDPQATVVSIDGVGAYDSISRKAMLEALFEVTGGSAALPFVRLFYGQPSRYLWDDQFGVVHNVDQGEGGEQGDAMMPLLFALGQHAALEAVQRRLLEGERLFAFLDDVYVLTTTIRVGDVYRALQEELFRHCRIRIHVGKTQVWNAAGIRPPACDMLERIAQASDSEARVWRGSEVPTSERGVRMLGTPLGHDDNVHLTRTLAQHDVLLSRIPLVEDVQSAWSLLLHCAGARANFLLRVVRPDLVHRFATGHNQGLWNCLSRILSIDFRHIAIDAHVPAGILGKLGRLPRHDQGKTSRCGSPDFAAWFGRFSHVAGCRVSGEKFAWGGGVCTPFMGSPRHGSGPPPDREPDDFEPGGVRHGWQHEAASRIERQFRGRLVPRSADHEQALWRSQSGPLAEVAFSTTPSSFLNRIDSHLFRVLLLRRLRLPLPSLCTSVSLWPFSWCFWPPSICMCEGRSSGKARFRCGECWGAHLSRKCYVTLTSRLLILVTNVGWRSWRMACHSMAERSWQSTQRSCPHCTATVLHAPMLPTSMALSWQRRAAARRERIQNSSVPAEERGWWFWLGRWGADGLRRPGVSFPTSPKRKQGRNHAFCKRGRSKLGGCGGALSWRARQLGPSLLLCWSCDTRSHAPSRW